jgi:hypothetical protein
MAPLVPEQNLVQMFLYGQSEKKRWGRSRNPKAAPPTAKFGTRHGNIQATLRVVGDSMVHSIATIRAESRKGNIVLDLVSSSDTFITLYHSDRSPGLYRPDEDGTYGCIFT